MESDQAEPGRRLLSGRDARWARERARFLAALAFSIALHALILSMELGIPGFALPWAGQRAQEMVLTVTLTVRTTERLAETPPSMPAEQPDGPAARGAPKPLAPSRADPSSFEMIVPTEAPVALPQKPAARPRRATSVSRPATEVPSTEPEIRPVPQPIVIAQDDPRPETFRVAPPETEPSRAPDVEAEEARRKSEVGSRKEEEARRLALEAEEASRKAEVGRRKEEEAKRLALEAETTRRAEEAARQQFAARQKELEARRQAEIEEASRKAEEAKRLALEAEEVSRKSEVGRRKEEEAKRLALEAEAARQQAAARQKELEARRQVEEAAVRARAQELAERQQAEARQKAEVERRKEEDAKRLAAEQAATRATAGASPPAGAAPAPGSLSGREIAAKAIEQLRTPGVIPLDPPRPPPPPPPPADGRRFPALGAERDVVLRYYIESWRAKIERNGPLNYRPLASRRAPEYPVVTVAVRSDGSLEHVHIHKSSGLREIDEAVRRIVEFNAPYSRFPPAIASQYDVIEIRRVWQFDDLLRIVEETR